MTSLRRFGLMLAAATIAACHDPSAGGLPDGELPDAGLPDAGLPDAMPPVYSATKLDVDLGHGNIVQSVLRSHNAAVSRDADAHWVLWDLAARAMVDSGDLPCGAARLPGCTGLSLALAGGTLAVRAGTKLELRAAATGAVQLSIDATPNAGLAADGSYVWTATASALQARSLAGTLLVDLAGNYAGASVYAEPATLRVVNGAAGGNTLELIQISDHQRTTVPFAGTFYSWFDDGRHFLTVTGSAVSVFTSAGVRQVIGDLPSTRGLTGQGDFVWTYNDQIPGYPLRIYPAADLSAPVQSFALDVLTQVAGAGPVIGVLPYGAEHLKLVALGPTVTMSAPLPVPAAYLSAFAGDDDGHWLVGGRAGVVFDGDAVVGPPAELRSLSLGTGWALAGSPGKTAALGVGSRHIEVLTLGASDATVRELDFAGSQLAITDDETTLIAADDLLESQYHEDRSLRVVSLADGNVTFTQPYAWSDPAARFYGFALAPRGGVLFQKVDRFSDATGWQPHDVFSDLAGHPFPSYGPQPSGKRPPTPSLSPDGARAAFSFGGQNSYGDDGPIGATTQLYSHGVLSGAVDGVFVTWLDSERVVVAKYSLMGGKVLSVAFDGMTIYDGGGNALGPAKLPDPKGTVTSIDGRLVYLQGKNAVCDVTTGAVVWQGDPTVTSGVVVGHDIVFARGHNVYRTAFL